MLLTRCLLSLHRFPTPSSSASTSGSAGSSRSRTSRPHENRPSGCRSISAAGIGVKKSSAQLTRHYSREALLDRLVVAVVNFPPKQIGPFMSEVLTLGVPDQDGEVVLLVPEQRRPARGRMF